LVTQDTSSSAAAKTNFDWALWLSSSEEDFRQSESLNPVKVAGSLDRKQFIEDLNRSGAPKGSFKSGLRGVGQTVSLPLISTGNTLSQGDYQRHQLRILVDEWLATGRNSDGTECPGSRNLTKTHKGIAAVRGFLGNNLARLEPSKNGLELVVFGGGDAGDQFTRLMLSEWRHRLAKCRACCRYFELSHQNRVYERGTLCAGCMRKSSLQSAVSSTKTRREAAAKTLYRLAAEWVLKRAPGNPEWHADQKIKDKLAKHLNEQINRKPYLASIYNSGGRNGITAIWIARTKNLQGIKDAMRAL
jgi:hypothetical protein